jgi:hypothetical protein
MIVNPLSLLFFHGTAEAGGSGRNRGLTLLVAPGIG